MESMTFKITNQRLVRTDKNAVVGDSRNYLTAAFEFTSDWEGMKRYAHFSDGNNLYDVEIKENKIAKEQGLNLSSGKWEIWLHGAKEDEVVTTNKVQIIVDRSGALYGDVFPGVRKGLTEEIINKVENMVGASTEDIENAVTKYLQENPPETGITEEAMQQYVDNAVENIDGGVTETEVTTAIENYMKLHPAQGVTTEQIANSVEAYMEEHPVSGGNTGTTESNAFNNLYIVVNGVAKKVKVNADGTLQIDQDAPQTEMEDLVEGRVLAWYDDFDGELDKTFYQPELGKVRGSANMWFTDDEEYLYISDSILHILGKKDGKYAATQGSNYTYTGAGVTTQGKWDFHFGLIEFKAKITGVAGAWPALWTCGQGFHKTYTVPTNTVDGSYWATQHGEIDIMEKLASMNNQFQSAYWYKTDGYGADVPRKGGQIGQKSMSTDDDWHIFGMEWTKDSIITYVDRTRIGSVSISGISQFQMPMQLLMGVGVDVSKGTPDEIAVLVDWVRYYLPSGQTNPVSAPTKITLSESNITLEPNGFYDFFPTYTPSGRIGNYAYSGTTNNKEVATVAGGRITAHGYGDCIVTIASSENSNVKETINVSVPTPVGTTMFTFTQSSLEFTDSTPQTIGYDRLPSGCTDVISWISDNTSVATVIDGVVTPRGNGQCTITATSGIYSQSCAISVNMETGEVDDDSVFTLNGVQKPDISSTYQITNSATTSNVSACVVDYSNDLLHIKNVSNSAAGSGNIGRSVTFLQEQQLHPAGKTIYEVRLKFTNNIGSTYLKEDMQNVRIAFDNGTTGVFITLQPRYGLRVIKGTETKHSTGDASYGTIANDTWYTVKIEMDVSNHSEGAKLYLDGILVHTLTQSELNTSSTANKNCPNLIFTDCEAFVSKFNFTVNN